MSSGDSLYVSSEYDPSRFVRFLHKYDRGASTKDIASLFSELGNAERFHYLYGACLPSLRVLTMFAVVAFVMLILKICGSDSVGFCSGEATQSSTAKSQKKKGYGAIDRDDYNNDSHVFNGIWLCTGRFSVIIFVAIIAAASGVLIVDGIDKIPGTINSLQGGIQKVENVADDIVDKIHHMTSVSNESVYLLSNHDSLFLKLDTFCSNPNVTLDSDLGMNMAMISTSLTTLEHFISSDISGFVTTLGNIKSNAHGVENMLRYVLEILQHYQFYIYPLWVFVGMFFLCTILAIANYSPRFLQNFLNWVALPLFLILTFLTCLAGCAVLTFAIMNADFCMGGNKPSPENTILSILENKGFHKDSIEYQSVRYYTSSCHTNARPPIDLSRFLPPLQSAYNQTTYAIGRLSSDNIAAKCGTDTTSLTVGLTNLKSNLVDIIDQVKQVDDELICVPLNKLYISVIHDDVCDDLVNDYGYIYISLFVICAFCLLLVMLRANWTETNYSNSVSTRGVQGKQSPFSQYLPAQSNVNGSPYNPLPLENPTNWQNNNDVPNQNFNYPQTFDPRTGQNMAPQVYDPRTGQNMIPRTDQNMTLSISYSGNGTPFFSPSNNYNQSNRPNYAPYLNPPNNNIPYQGQFSNVPYQIQPNNNTHLNQPNNNQNHFDAADQQANAAGNQLQPGVRPSLIGNNLQKSQTQFDNASQQAKESGGEQKQFAVVY